MRIDTEQSQQAKGFKKKVPLVPMILSDEHTASNSKSQAKTRREAATAKLVGLSALLLFGGAYLVPALCNVLSQAGILVKTDISNLGFQPGQAKKMNDDLPYCVNNLADPAQMTIKNLSKKSPTLDKNGCAAEIQVTDSVTLTPQKGIAEKGITLETDSSATPVTGDLLRDRNGQQIFLPNGSQTQTIEKLVYEQKQTVTLTGLDGQLAQLQTVPDRNGNYDHYRDVFSIVRDGLKINGATVFAGSRQAGQGEIAFVLSPTTSRRNRRIS